MPSCARTAAARCPTCSRMRCTRILLSSSGASAPTQHTRVLQAAENAFDLLLAGVSVPHLLGGPVQPVRDQTVRPKAGAPQALRNQHCQNRIAGGSGRRAAEFVADQVRDEGARSQAADAVAKPALGEAAAGLAQFHDRRPHRLQALLRVVVRLCSCSRQTAPNTSGRQVFLACTTIRSAAARTQRCAA